MRQFIFLYCFLACFNQCFGKAFDLYSRRYDLRDSTTDSLSVDAGGGETVLVKGIRELLTTTSVDPNSPCRTTLPPSFTNGTYLKEFKKCPQIFEAIRYKNISTWGPLEDFIHLDLRIDGFNLFIASTSPSPSGRFDCRAFDWLWKDQTELGDWLLTKYTPKFCQVNDNSTFLWHTLLEDPMFDLHLDQINIYESDLERLRFFTRIAASKARYDAYFEATPEYPLIKYMNATLSSSEYTLTQKSYIKQLMNAFKQKFPSLDNKGRRHFLSMKFTEAIDLSYSYYATLARIPMDPIDGFRLYEFLLLKDN